jgi:hypothetical protein
MARRLPASVITWSCRQYRRFESCRGHSLTSADINPCKIHAIKAPGVAPQQKGHHHEPNGIDLIPGHELVDDLVRRVGPDEAVRLFNEGFRCPVSSIAELRRRLSDTEGRIAL